MRNKTRELVYGALLTALALIIPIVFGGYLRVMIYPFTATLVSHVPLFLSILISPLVAAAVGIGSTIGFLITMGPLIAARAAVHIVAGVAGAITIRRGMPYVGALLLMLPIHAVGEALAVLPFVGLNLYEAGLLVGVGTALHHIVDAAIAVMVVSVLTRIPILGHVFKKT